MTGLSLGWLVLLALPLAFGLGWLASRLDLRQWRQAERKAPDAYFKGLNLLLADQPDKAIDAFIEAVQADADTSELHFALGSLFRRRGEFERAIRVHEHLLQRADLSRADRERAQYALAQDFTKAGLLDRAEAAYRALAGTPRDAEAKLALLTLHERARDWPAASAVAAELEQAGLGSFAERIAHHLCERAAEAEAKSDAAEARRLLDQARLAAPSAARPWLQTAQFQQRQGRQAEAMSAYLELLQRQPEAFARVSEDAVAAVLDACAAAASRESADGQAGAPIGAEVGAEVGTQVHEPASAASPAAQGTDLQVWRSALSQALAQRPGLDLLRALGKIRGVPPAALPDWLDLLRLRPSLSAVMEGVHIPREQWPPEAGAVVRQAVEGAARPLQRYRCAACGFETQRYFWQCPGCLGWDTFPPRRLEEL